MTPARRVLVLALTALTLAGCGAGDSGGDTPATAAGTGEFPRSIEHAFGTTTVPAAPRRVVALGKNDAEALVSLGLPPIAVSSGLEVYPWLDDPLEAADSVRLADDAGPPLEQIASLRPDLIVAMDIVDEAEYEALSKIAPVLTYARERSDYSWQELTRWVGKATGRDDRADEVVADTEARVREIAEANPAIAGKTFSLSYLSADFPLVRYEDGDPAVDFFTELGMRRSANLDKMAGGEIPLRDSYLSLERIDLLDADVVITGFQTPKEKTFFEGKRVFNRMAAVRRGSVLELDTADIGQVLLPSALGNVSVLERIAPRLQAAAERAG